MEVFALLDAVRFYIVEAVDELLVGCLLYTSLATLQLITVFFAGMKIGNVLLRTVVVVRCLILAIT